VAVIRSANKGNSKKGRRAKTKGTDTSGGATMGKGVIEVEGES